MLGMVDPKPATAKPVDHAAQVEEVILRMARMAKTTTVLVGAVVVLVAAIFGGYYHIQGIVQKAAVEREANRVRTELTRDQAKAAAGDLAADVETLSAQVQQTQQDLADLREYIAVLTLPLGHGQTKPAVRTTKPAAPPAATQEPILPAPPPPEVAPPAPIDLKSEKMNDRFKD